MIVVRSPQRPAVVREASYSPRKTLPAECDGDRDSFEGLARLEHEAPLMLHVGGPN